MIDVDWGYNPALRDQEGNIIVAQPSAGVQTRFTQEGIAVHMYWHEPGKYYGDHGQEFPESMALAANFPVEEYSLLRRRNEALSKAEQEIEKEFSQHKTRVVELTRGEYSLINIGNENYNIEFTDGTLMNTRPLPKNIAIKVMDNLAPKTQAAVGTKKAA